MAAYKYSIWVGWTLSIVLVILFVLQIAAASPDFDDYADYDLPEGVGAVGEKRHLGSIAAQSGMRGPFSRPSALGEVDNNSKYKRFLGSLARGGWFPRQFRGFVNNPMGQTGYQQKRHIGAVARLGWLPAPARSREDYHY